MTSLTLLRDDTGKGWQMRSLGQKSFSAAVRRLVADRRDVPAAAPRARPESKDGRRRTPSATTMRHDLESFRRAQGAAYWHHDRRPGEFVSRPVRHFYQNVICIERVKVRQKLRPGAFLNRLATIIPEAKVNRRNRLDSIQQAVDRCGGPRRA